MEQTQCLMEHVPYLMEQTQDIRTVFNGTPRYVVDKRYSVCYDSMRDGKSHSIAIFHEDYLLLKEEFSCKRPGITLMGLIHEMIIKTEPKSRDIKGKFSTIKDG